MEWVNVTVTSGPERLIGKSGKVPLKLMTKSDWEAEACAGQTHTYHYIGSEDFLRMFGKFEGIEMISKNHIEIQLLFPFQITNEFIVSGGLTGFRTGARLQDVSFPTGENSGTFVNVNVADVITIRLVIGSDSNQLDTLILE